MRDGGKPIRRRLVLVASASVAGLLAGPAGAETFPSRPIRIIVPYSAAGPADIAARILADQLAAGLSQRVIVDNRPGGGGMIGMQLGATAAPDGYTMLLTGNNLAIAEALFATSAGFDASDSFRHLGQIAVLPSELFVSAASRFAALGDVVTAARSAPGDLTYGTGGIGSPSHLAMELLRRRAGIELRHIPYKGTAPALTDVLGGQIDMLFTSIAGPMQHVKAGRLRLLALSSPDRLPQLPEIPTIAEAFPGYAAETWLGLSAPRGVPAELAARLAGEIGRAVADPNLAKRMEEAGLTARALPPDAMADKVRQEQALYGRVVKEADIKSE